MSSLGPAFVESILHFSHRVTKGFSARSCLYSALSLLMILLKSPHFYQGDHAHLAPISCISYESMRCSLMIPGEMMNRMTLKTRLLPDVDLTQTPLSADERIPRSRSLLWLHLATNEVAHIRRKSAEGVAGLAFLGSLGAIITLRTSRNHGTATGSSSAFTSYAFWPTHRLEESGVHIS